MHWHFNIRTRARTWIAILAVVVTATGLLVKRSLASDHQDTADVELNPSMDMTDVYAFPGSSASRIALVLDSWALLTPAEAQPGVTSFDDNLLYQFKVDNTGDAQEDKVIQVTFHGSGSDQTVEVRGPMAPPVVGAMRNTVSDASPTISGKVNTMLGSPTACRCSRVRVRIRSTSISSSSSASSPIASRSPARSRCSPTRRPRAASARRAAPSTSSADPADNRSTSSRS